MIVYNGGVPLFVTDGSSILWMPIRLTVSSWPSADCNTYLWCIYIHIYIFIYIYAFLWTCRPLSHRRYASCTPTTTGYVCIRLTPPKAEFGETHWQDWPTRSLHKVLSSHVPFLTESFDNETPPQCLPCTAVRWRSRRWPSVIIFTKKIYSSNQWAFYR